MIEEEKDAAEQLPLEGAGQKLRRAREDKSLSVEQVAAETRIPSRHLEAIEQGDFSALPSRAYAIGFSRTYANLLGLDQEAIISEVRAELAVAQEEGETYHSSFEPGDPAKVPSTGLVWFAAIAVVLLLAGIISFYGSYFSAGEGPASLLVQEEVSSEAELARAGNGTDAAADDAAATAQPDGGQVVFTALEDGVWARFYDGSGARLLEKQMANGERFIVPADADNPQIWTGRPDAFAITIGGQEVPKLAEDDFVMRDVSVTAAALLARGQNAEETSPST
ncbi:MAG: RodZ domain-containing protein [Erythrobacter sp.]